MIETVKKAIIPVFAALALVLGVLTTLVLYPFAPFAISNFHTTPDQACPLANVSAAANVSVEDGWDLKKLTIESTWKPVGDKEGLPVSGGTAIILDPGPELEKSSKSPILRPAPEAPGTYKSRSEATMIGTFSKDNPAHGWPKIQIVVYNAENTLTVLPPTSPECKEKP